MYVFASRMCDQDLYWTCACRCPSGCSLALQRVDEVQARARRQNPAVLALVGVQQAVELFQMGHDVVFDIGDGDLEAHASAVEGSRVVSGKHFRDHASHHGNDLQ